MLICWVVMPAVQWQRSRSATFKVTQIQLSLPFWVHKQWNIVPNKVAAEYMCCRRRTLEIVTLLLQNRQEHFSTNKMQKPIYIYMAETEGDSLFHTQSQSKENKHGTLFINTVQVASILGFKLGIRPITEKKHEMDEKYN